MLQAAKITAEYIEQNFKNKEYICVCGPGNNGGDGYYVGIYLYKAGFDVKIINALEHKTKSHTLAYISISIYIYTPHRSPHR